MFHWYCRRSIIFCYTTELRHNYNWTPPYILSSLSVLDRKSVPSGQGCLLMEGWNYTVSTLYVSRTMTKTTRFKRWLMSFCTVVVFVDKLLLSDMLLIYEHTTFASQNDVQNHHKNIRPRLGLKMGEEGGSWWISCAFDIIQDNTYT